MMNAYVYDSISAPTVTGSKHCIIFDLDQTLVSTEESDCGMIKQQLSKPGFESVRDRMYELTAQPENSYDKPFSFWGTLRPHTIEFLEFCFSYFRVVGVWSAGTHNYVHEIVKFIFHQKMGREPHLVFTRRDIIRNTETDVGKPLEKMYNFNEVFGRYMKPENTFIIDDNYTTAIYNEKNIVHIPPYQPHCNVNDLLLDDIALPELRKWFLQPEVRLAEDVRLLDKSRIFSRASY